MTTGFFSAVLVAIVAQIADKGVTGKVVLAFMCHNPAPESGFEEE